MERKTKVRINDSVGKTLASPIYNENKVLLMKEGIVLTKDRIDILKRHNIAIVKVFA